MGFNLIILFLFTCLIVFSGVLVMAEQPPETEFSAAEKEALAKLKPLVNDILYDKRYMIYDEFLIRYLRARKLNVNDTVELLRKTMTWRRQNRIDNITTETMELEKFMPYTIGPLDRHLRPIGIFRIGKWKLRRIAIGGRTDEASRVIFKIMETIAEKVVRSNTPEHRNITSAYMILDLNGFNNRDHACLACTPMGLELFQVYENYYPHGAHKIVGVNVPRLFETLWTVFKPVMSPVTLDTFKLYGYNKQDWKSALRKDISDDQLPDYLGGNYVTDRIR